MIELKPNSEEYFDLWIKWRNEPNTRRYNPIQDTSDLELRENCRKTGGSLADLKAADQFRLFAEWQGQIVGNVTLKNLSYTMQHGEIGYGLGEEYQGKGLGTLMVEAFVRKIFAETSLRRLFAYVAEDNMPSRRVLEKIGFSCEGICREHYIVNGRPTNEVLYAILRSDLEKPMGVRTDIIRILSVDHAQITIPKEAEAEARKFYCEFLGLKEIGKPANRKKNGGFWLQVGDVQVHVGTEDGIDRLKTKAHVAYRVNDLKRWRQKFQQRGIETFDTPALPAAQSFEFRDPFGNRVELIQHP